MSPAGMIWDLIGGLCSSTYLNVYCEIWWEIFDALWGNIHPVLKSLHGSHQLTFFSPDGAEEFQLEGEMVAVPPV